MLAFLLASCGSSTSARIPARDVADRFNIPYEQARWLQKSYFRGYGTTMKGLMTEYGVNPIEFLDFVHLIDHSPVQADPRLDAALAVAA